MGSLTFPSSGPIYLDTNGFIYSVECTTAAIWEHAARLRASTGMKTPDALHAATSLAAGSTLFISNDEAFRRVADLPLALLDDLVREGEEQ